MTTLEKTWEEIKPAAWKLLSEYAEMIDEMFGPALIYAEEPVERAIDFALRGYRMRIVQEHPGKEPEPLGKVVVDYVSPVGTRDLSVLTVSLNKLDRDIGFYQHWTGYGDWTAEELKNALEEWGWPSKIRLDLKAFQKAIGFRIPTSPQTWYPRPPKPRW